MCFIFKIKNEFYYPDRIIGIAKLEGQPIC